MKAGFYWIRNRQTGDVDIINVEGDAQYWEIAAFGTDVPLFPRDLAKYDMIGPLTPPEQGWQPMPIVEEAYGHGV